MTTHIGKDPEETIRQTIASKVQRTSTELLALKRSNGVAMVQGLAKAPFPARLRITHLHKEEPEITWGWCYHLW